MLTNQEQVNIIIYIPTLTVLFRQACSESHLLLLYKNLINTNSTDFQKLDYSEAPKPDIESTEP